MKYPLAKQGVFHTVQGEGSLLGVPMVFIRIAGCSVNCDHCDTDYRVHTQEVVTSITEKVLRELGDQAEWVWITGGEPLDYDLAPLVTSLKDVGLRIAIATTGEKPICSTFSKSFLPDFVSVSPHRPEKWLISKGEQLNLVPGLGGLSLTDPTLLTKLKIWEGNFQYKYVTPRMDREGRIENLQECLNFIKRRKGWRLGTQAHKYWNLP